MTERTAKRAANCHAVRDAKLAECERLGISMRELKRRRQAEEAEMQRVFRDFDEEWGLS